MLNVKKEVGAMVLSNIKHHPLSEILNHFPSQSISYIFGYGSKVMTPYQSGNERKMTNLIFAVDYPQAWHKRNFDMNPSHYSFLKHFGSKAIARIQEKWACGVYFNPYVVVDRKLIKYGVISTSALNEDLTSWKHMYIAGRLQNPVLELKPPTSAKLKENITKNHMAALRTVLLQLPPESSKYELYYGITSLSYVGDFRIYIDEDPKRLKAFVEPLIPEFDKIYMPLIESLKPIVKMSKDKNIILQENSPEIHLSHLLALPSRIQIYMCKRFKYNLAVYDVEEAMVHLSKVRHIDMYVLQSISKIVAKSKRKQLFQGFLTAGFFKSLMYAADTLASKLNRHKREHDQRQAQSSNYNGNHGVKIKDEDKKSKT